MTKVVDTENPPCREANVLVAQLEDKVNQLNNLTTHSLKYFVEIIDQTYRHY